MAEFEITERTEPFTFDEVFSFIDDTNISKMDAHELKSRIADAVKGIRENTIDEFVNALINYKSHGEEYKSLSDVCYEIAEQLKGDAE